MGSFDSCMVYFVECIHRCRSSQDGRARLRRSGSMAELNIGEKANVEALLMGLYHPIAYSHTWPCHISLSIPLQP